MRGERDVLAQLAQELAVAAAEAVGARAAPRSARRTPGSRPAAARRPARAVRGGETLRDRECRPCWYRARRPARRCTQRDSPFSSIGSAVPCWICQRRRARHASAGRRSRPSSRCAVASYRQMHAKSIGRLSSRLRTTTWKMLSRSWRSPIARVVPLQQVEARDLALQLALRRFAFLQILAQRVVLRLDAREHVVERGGQRLEFAVATRRRAHAEVAALGHGARGFGEGQQRLRDACLEDPRQEVGEQQRSDHRRSGDRAPQPESRVQRDSCRRECKEYRDDGRPAHAPARIPRDGRC